MISAVAFDLDGTLFDRDRSVAQQIAWQYRRFADVLGHVSCELYVQRFLRLDAHGYVAKDVVYRQLVDEWRLEPTMHGRLYDDFRATYHAACIAFPGAVETLATLRAEGRRIGIITNGQTTTQKGVIAALGLEPYVDAILVSEAEGIRKPQPAIFERAATRLNTRTAACIFVGDHSVVDIQGAHDAGWWTVWKRNAVWDAPGVADAQIDHLDDLIEVVRAIEHQAQASPDKRPRTII